jgi:peroxiredoxin
MIRSSTPFTFGLALLLASAPLLPAQTNPETVPVESPTDKIARFLHAGDMAPEFTVQNAKGASVKLSDYRGKVVIVDVSATWCGPCQAAMPNNDRVYRKYAAQGVVLIGITADDAKAAYDGWLERNAAKYQFEMFFDPAGKDGWKDSVFNKDYHITGFPTMFVIDRTGKISEIVGGGGPGEDYRLEYALARTGIKVDLASIPPEPKKTGPASVPMVAKTPAMPAATKAAGGMVGMAGGSGRDLIPKKFGNIASGDPVPDFTVTGVDGKPLTLASFRGKPLLVHFVSSGMGPQPWMADILKTYADQGLVALVIFSATERTDFDAWVAKNPARTFAVAWDPAGKAWAEGVTNTTFGVGMFPATFVVTAEGKLISGFIGMGDRAAVQTKMMLMAAGAIKPTEADMAAIRALVQAEIGAGGGMRPATPSAPAKPATLAAGAVAPDFLMHDINDKEVRLSDFKGKVVILDFWATWCGPCIASMPHTNELAAKYADQDVVVLASGTSDLIAKFKDWIPKNQPKYPNLRFAFDLNERDSATFESRPSSKLYGVTGIPTQFVIGRDGKITATIVGNGGNEDARTEAALARAGVKVDAVRVEAGEKQLKAAAEEEVNRLAAAKEEEKNPTPKFRVTFGKLTQGQPVPDFTAEAPDGTAVKFSELTKGKTTVFMVWSARSGPTAAALDYVEGWAKRYADQGVLFLGLASYGAREDFAKWYAANGAKISFPVLFDPVGVPPTPAKAMEEMTEQERNAFRDASRAHFAKVIPMAFLGGVMAPVPNNVIIDPKGNFLGFYVGAGPGAADSLGNLLLRAGVKLKPEDMPPKVFSADDTKEKPAEAKVEMLKVGAVAPDFPATDAAGKAVKVSDYRGKVVILDFWATWCGPCLASMPHTQEVAAHYKDQGVVVIASCTSDTRAKFDGWVKANQPLYPDINFSHDPQERGADRASHKFYGVGGIPQQFIIDRDGKVAALVTGYLKGEAILDAALAKAGIKVDPALIEKGALDLKKREMMR